LWENFTADGTALLEIGEKGLHDRLARKILVYGKNKKKVEVQESRSDPVGKGPRVGEGCLKPVKDKGGGGGAE